MKERIAWLNTAKALGILAIYYRHSEIYYSCTDEPSVLTASYLPFYVTIFFFVNGYLLFRKHLGTAPQKHIQFGANEYKAALQNIMFRLAIPTLLFSSIIYIPKMWFHGSEADPLQYFHDVFGGVCFWFTSALTVAQVLLLSMMLVRKQSAWFYLLATTPLLIAGIVLGQTAGTVFPWYWQSALVATFILALGGAYMKHEKTIDKHVKPAGAVLIIAAYTVLMLTVQPANTMIGPVRIDITGLLAILLGTASLVAVSKGIPAVKGLDYIGSHTITLYFLSGAIPATVATLCHRLMPETHSALTLLVAIVSLATGIAATWAIKRFCPFMLDLRLLWNKNKKTNH